MEFVLPSSGDVLEIRGLTLGEQGELIRGAGQGRKGFAAINRVLQACILTPGYEVEKMFIGDRTALLIGVRVATFGPDFEFQATCPACNTKALYRQNLNELPVKYADPPIKWGDDPHYRFTLPHAGKTVVWRHLRGQDELVLSNLRANEPDRDITAQELRLRTVEVEGLPNVSVKWFEDLQADDVAYLLGDIEAHDFGVDTTLDCTCGVCGFNFQLPLPFGSPDFLRPKKRPRS